jgi:polysaccharide chain length determinant protein (PEP-CTERM system associated)
VLPGKTFTPEDIVRIAWRRKWLILWPFLAISLGTILVAWKLPEQYRAETLIAVVPQRVPEDYVKPTVTTKIEDRLQAITQKVQSRTSLERIIQEFNLYPRERRTGLMEDVVDKMRNDIKVETIKGDAFRISYVNRDPHVAMRVTERLANQYQDESLNDRTLQAQQTASFLETQLVDARRQLEDHERKLAEYKTKHEGELPSELQANLQVLNNTQMQLQTLAQSINQDKNRRYLIEKTIAELSQPASQSVPTVTISGDDPTRVAGGSTAAQLEVAKAQLQLLQLSLTPDHPDVKRMKRTIRDLEAKLQAEALQRPVSPGAGDRPASPEEEQRIAHLKSAQTELEMVDRQIATQQAEEKRLRAVMAEYQGRAEATAGRESELTGLMRDYDTLRKNYDSLLTKREDAKVAASMEDRAAGEQFRTLDPARLPERPISPNRPLIDLAGAVAGLAVGLGLVALLEYRDNSFQTDEEVVRLLSLPVVAVIPLMLSAAERRKQRHVKLVVSTVTTIVVLAVLSGTVWFFWWSQT